MHKNYISNSSSSVRMFKSRFLESVSKVHFWVPLVLYMPVILFMLIGQLLKGRSWDSWLLYSFLGVISWTIVEYVMHRFVFHFEPKGKLGRRLHFIIHGVHHDYPNDQKRLVMPPSLSMPLAILFYLLFKLIVPVSGLAIFYSFFLIGYLVYDLGHYALHHCHFKNAIFRQLKKNHMRHHYQDPTKGYGVSSVIWDHVLSTAYPKTKQKPPTTVDPKATKL